MIEQQLDNLDYNVIIVGAGAVLQEKFTPQVLDRLGPESKRTIVDLSIQRLHDTGTKSRFNRRVVADGAMVPFRIPGAREKNYVGIVTTPEHLSVVRSFTEAGIRQFIVEKPLVNNFDEMDELKKQISRIPNLKVYPLDFYIQKVAPLLILTGKIAPLDPRYQWVSLPPKMGSINDYIGDLEGIQVNVFEGGNLGLPDLAKRKWLEEDNLRGGMLLDLGTHALTPLIVAGVIPSEGVTVDWATRKVLGKDRASFVSGLASQPEIFSSALLSVPTENGVIPCFMNVGKSFHTGGMWEFVLRGSKGDVVMGLRTGQKLTVIPRSSPSFDLALRVNDPYGMAFQEARMYFDGYPGFDGNLSAMLSAIEVIEEIKANT